MASFLEKLKKGMGIEISEEKIEKEERLEKKPKKEDKLPAEETKPTPKKTTTPPPHPPASRAPRRVQKLKVETKLVEPEIEKIEEPEKLDYNPPATLQPKPSHPKKEISAPSRNLVWQNLGRQEGQLAVDVYQTENEIVIQSTIAGVKPEDLDISIESDAILIKGSREQLPETGERNYFYQECYWGPFSRQIILPEETDPNQAEATMKEGILTIRIPKIERKKKRKIEVKE